MVEQAADAGGGGPVGIAEGLGEVDVVGVEVVAALDDDRLEDLKRKINPTIIFPPQKKKIKMAKTLVYWWFEALLYV